MKYMVIAAEPFSLINFRKELINAILNQGNEVVCLASKTDPAVECELAYMGASYLRYPLDRTGLNILKDLQSMRALRHAIKQERPDVIVAYTIKPVIWTGIALYKTRKPTYIPLITGLGMLFEKSSLKRRLLNFWIKKLYRLALQNAQHVIFQNPDNRRQFITDHLVKQENSSVVLGSGIDTQLFSQHPLPETEITFLLIARLLVDKGIREFAQAAKAIKNRHPEVQFILAGPEDTSPNRLKLSEVVKWEEAGILHYVGETKDVHDLLKTCHVFVLPSYHEGLPRTVLEAMATGRPVITTDVPGCRETVRNNVNGLLTNKQDAESLIEAMDWCIENQHKLQKMGDTGRRIAEDEFETRRINGELLIKIHENYKG